jgi:hypothetical protein
MKKIIAIIAVLLFVSCSVEKEYEYVFHYNQIDRINGKQHKTFEPEIVKAKNDTIAFYKAYEKYIISKKSIENTSDKSKYLTAVALRFEIRNKANKDFYFFTKMRFTDKKRDSIKNKHYN